LEATTMTDARTTSAAEVSTALMHGAAAAKAGTSGNTDQTNSVAYKTAKVGTLDIFYREAGPKQAPTVLLMHGFPSSSFMFRDLIPALATRYHVIAPDYPGFGQSSFPDRTSFRYTFENIANVMDDFTRTIGATRYAIYVQDYGSPVGLRLAIKHPERITALIVQNGNAYEEGLSNEWDLLRTYWQNPSAENREKLRAWVTADGIRASYAAGLPADQLVKLSPDTWTLDWGLLSRPGNVDVQLDLFADYRSNVALYPKFHEFFRTKRPPTLITWGARDVFFTQDGARAFLKDLPDAELHILPDAGHFALETHGEEIAPLIRSFLDRRVPRAGSPQSPGGSESGTVSLEPPGD
jgi:pimeloyl-ACP methyl ester carboxylesterase